MLFTIGLFKLLCLCRLIEAELHGKFEAVSAQQSSREETSGRTEGLAEAESGLQGNGDQDTYEDYDNDNDRYRRRLLQYSHLNRKYSGQDYAEV